jgi:hypothetical protein
LSMIFTVFMGFYAILQNFIFYKFFSKNIYRKKNYKSTMYNNNTGISPNQREE